MTTKQHDLQRNQRFKSEHSKVLLVSYRRQRQPGIIDPATTKLERENTSYILLSNPQEGGQSDDNTTPALLPTRNQKNQQQLYNQVYNRSVVQMFIIDNLRHISDYS